MRVIGAAWGRTGTTSAAAALEMLGIAPCVQMQTMWQRLDLAEIWVRHHRGEPVDWRSVLNKFDASVDWPECWQWQEFATLWPDAKVLLTFRDPDAWYESVLGSIHAWTAPGADVGPPVVAELLTMVWDEEFGGWERVLDREHAITAYLAHVDLVRRECPPDRLLEWQVTDGWQPLCDRLGVPEPDAPVPHLNSRTN